jgi:hypothetical protein
MLAMINTLPNEVLEHIFHMVVASDKVARASSTKHRHDLVESPHLKAELHAVVLVCSRWNAIVDSSGRFRKLFITIDHQEPDNDNDPGEPLKDQAQRALKALSASATCDLHIDFRVEAPNLVANSINIGDILDCLRKIIDHSRQIVAFDVSFSSHSLARKFWPALVRLSSVPVSRLDSITLSIIDSEDSESEINIHGSRNGVWNGERIDLSHANNLRSISAFGLDIMQAFTPPAGLERLSLDTKASTTQDWTELSRMLHSISNLRLLWCEETSTTYGSKETQASPILSLQDHSSRLARLDIYGSEAFLITFMRSINLRSLTHLIASLKEVSNDDTGQNCGSLPVLHSLKEACFRPYTWTSNIETILSACLPQHLDRLTLCVPEVSQASRRSSLRTKIPLRTINSCKLIVRPQSESRLFSFLDLLDLSGVKSLDVTIHMSDALGDAEVAQIEVPSLEFRSLQRLCLSVAHHDRLPIIKTLLLAITAPNCRSLEVVLRRDTPVWSQNRWQSVDQALLTLFLPFKSSILPSLSKLRLVDQDEWGVIGAKSSPELPLCREALKSAVAWRAQNAMPTLACSFHDSLELRWKVET